MNKMILSGIIALCLGACSTAPEPIVYEERSRIKVPIDQNYLPPPKPRCFSTWDQTPKGMIERKVCDLV